MAVYTNNTFASSNLVAQNDDAKEAAILYSRILLDVVSNTVYNIAVDGWEGDRGTVMLKVTPVAKITSLALTPDQEFQLTFPTFLDFSYEILGSTDLINWQTLMIIPGTGNNQQFVDVEAPFLEHRFYKIIEW